MPFDPDYGDTHVSDEDRDALTPTVKKLLGENILKADLYDLEQQLQAEVADDLVSEVFAGSLTVSDLLTDHFLRSLHRALYRPIWNWGGKQRNRETNIGIAPEQISVALKSALDNLLYRWELRDGVSARYLGIAAHASLVHIHPFIDGNGRTTRLLADLIYLAGQSESEVRVYEWNVDRDAYIHQLRQYDETQNPQPLVDLITVVELSEQI